jgi:polyhydroxybutyrate depolymerase
MKLAHAILALPLFAFSCAPLPLAKPRIEPGRYVKSIEEGGIERSYILRVPWKYDSRTRLPLVILLHGWGSNALDAETATRFGAKSEQEGFLLAVPNGTEGVGKLKGWNVGFLRLGGQNVDDVKFTGDLLDQLERDLAVDENRVYVAGHSNGAMMAYELGAKLSDRIAAIAVVSGTIGTLHQRVDVPLSPVSAIIFHGKEDATVPYDDSAKALLQSISAPESAKWWASKDGCGDASETIEQKGEVAICDYRGGRNKTEVELVSIAKGDHSWPSDVRATDMIWDFFRSHPRAGG